MMNKKIKRLYEYKERLNEIVNKEEGKVTSKEDHIMFNELSLEEKKITLKINKTRKVGFIPTFYFRCV